MERFTKAVRLAIANQNWYGALLIALTLPDICGWLENPNHKTQVRYEKWWKSYVQSKYSPIIAGQQCIFLGGRDCYALRCSYLHQGGNDITDQKAREVLERFQFVTPGQIVSMHCNRFDNRLQLQVDVFCEDVCLGVEEWVKKVVDSRPAVQQRLKSLLTIDPLENLQKF